MVQIEQGRLLEWNPDTFESVIESGGLLLTNPPVVHDSVTEALRVDDRVALMRNDSDSPWWIIGRLVTPASGG